MSQAPQPIRGVLLGLVAMALASCSKATPAATSSSPQSPVPSATASPSSSPTPSPSVAPILADDVCTAIDATAIDSILGLHVGGGVSGSSTCSWKSQHPAGTLTLARLTEAQVRHELSLGTEPKVVGIGIRAFGFSQGGLPAPNAPSGATLTVDFGTYGLYENLSGPAVTVKDAVKIARLVSTPP